VTPLNLLLVGVLLIPAFALAAVPEPVAGSSPRSLSPRSTAPASIHPAARSTIHPAARSTDRPRARSTDPLASPRQVLTPIGISSQTPPDRSPAEWAWPLQPRPPVIRGFLLGPTPWSAGHRGVDLLTAPGAAVHAPAAGMIRFTGVIAGRPVLSIDHGGGLISSVEPVLGLRTAGEVVRRGDVVGTIAPGATHCSPRTCLHWGVRRNGQYIDPLTLLPGQRGPIVLLPLVGANR
jgi:murein DD-endopeptidase MepM/ murein hydrolase activator NlpD